MAEEAAPGGGQERSSVLRILRVKKGMVCKVWLLSDRYQGTMTHYREAGSKICQGRDCPATIHKLDLQWKGYGAALVWSDPDNLWAPVVLELSENSELDVRGRWARGQMWEFSKPGPEGKRNSPIVGVLIAESMEVEPPPPFPIVDTLCRFYGTDCLNLGTPNPLPPRTVVTWSKGPPPPSRLVEQRRLERVEANNDRLSGEEIQRRLDKVLDRRNGTH